MKQLKCLHIVPPSSGGIQQHVLSILSDINDDQINWLVASPMDLKFKRKVEELEVEFIPLNWKGNMISNLYVMGQLLNTINTKEINLIHTHGFRAEIMGKMSKLANKRLININTIHNFYPKSLGNKFNRLIMKGIHRHTDHIITVSNALRSEVHSSLHEKVTTIYNGVNVKLEHRQEKAENTPCKNQDDNLIIGTVCRLAPQKGIDVLINAFAKLKAKPDYNNKNMYLYIVGDGPLYSDLKNIIAENKLEASVKLVGWQEDVNLWLEKIDVFVMPSISEGLSIATIEAMIAAKPIVVTSAGGLIELIDNHKTGIVVEPNNRDDLASGIEKLIIDRQLAEELANSARAKAEKYFSNTKMAEQTRAVYRKYITSEDKVKYDA